MGERCLDMSSITAVVIDIPPRLLQSHNIVAAGQWHIGHGRPIDDLTAIYCGPLQSGRINSHQTILVPYTALIDLCRNTVNFSVFVIIIVMCSSQNDWLSVTFEIRIQYVSLDLPVSTVYPKKYAYGFVVLCFVVVMQSFIMNSHEVFIHIHQGCFAGTGAIVRLPQCQWSEPDGYGKISQCITTTKHSKAKTVCIFLGIYCIHADEMCLCSCGFIIWHSLRIHVLHLPIIVQLHYWNMWFSGKGENGGKLL